MFRCFDRNTIHNSGGEAQGGGARNGRSGNKNTSKSSEHKKVALQNDGRGKGGEETQSQWQAEQSQVEEYADKLASLLITMDENPRAWRFQECSVGGWSRKLCGRAASLDPFISGFLIFLGSDLKGRGLVKLIGGLGFGLQRQEQLPDRPVEDHPLRDGLPQS